MPVATAAAYTIDLRVLGPLEVRAGGVVLSPGPRKQQVVLAMLAIHAGRVVSLEELVDEVWPEVPPASAIANVRSYAASIRRQLEAVEVRRDRLVRRGSSYQLNVAPDELDLLTFTSLLAEGGEALRSADPATAVAVFRQALALWRGPMLTGLPLGPTLAGRSAVVEEERLAATEDLADAHLALDEPDQVLRVLRPHLHTHPLRERAYGLLMTAQCRLGDVAGALSTYAEARDALVERLGIEPGAELRRLHRSVLDGDPDMGNGKTLTVTHRASVVKPAELPADLVDFVGRDAEIQRVIAQLSTPRATAVPVCGVVGQAGIGKTSLAVHVAHRLRASYPDGQLFVDLRGADRHPLSSAEVLARFLRALGVPGPVIPNDAHERGTLYRSRVADRRLLVVLDNAADEEQVRPLLPGTPTCAVLVTSRYRLPGLVGLASVDLGVLGTDSAVALLANTAGSGRIHAEPDAAEELTRLCGGLPLALRVVAAKLASSPHRTLTALVDRLAEERHRLDQLAHAGLAVRSSLDFSYDRLDPADQKLLRRVSLLDVPDFAAWTAAAAVDEAVPVVEEGLDRLATVHLVQVAGTDVAGQVRYRMHDLIRVYARERATSEEPDPDRLAAIRGAVHHWLGLVTAGEEALFGPGYYVRLGREVGAAVLDRATVDRVSTDPLAWIEAERAALVSTVRQAAAVGLLAECWRLACVSRSMLTYREFWDEEATCYTIAVDAARRLGDRRGEAVALFGLGRVEAERGNWARGRSLIEGAEATFAALGDTLGVARCQWELARLDRLGGELGSAKDRYLAMIEAGQGVDLATEAMGLRGLAQVELFAGNPGAALPLLESALEVSGRGAGTVTGQLVLVWYGEACLQLGRAREAADAFGEVVSWAGRVGATSGQIRGLLGLARVALVEGDADEADRLASKAHRQCELLDEPWIGMEASATLGRARLARGDLESATKLAQEALDCCQRLGDVVNQSRTLELMAELHQAAGDPEAAQAARAEAAKLHPTAQSG